MVWFLLGISLTINVLLIFILVKLKDKLEIKECVIDEKAFEEFEKEDKKSWSGFFNNSK